MMLDRHQIIKHGSDECRSAWNVSACDPSRCSSTLGPHSVRTVLSEGRNGPGDRAPPKISWRGRLALVCLRAQFGRTHHSEQVSVSARAPVCRTTAHHATREVQRRRGTEVPTTLWALIARCENIAAMAGRIGRFIGGYRSAVQKKDCVGHVRVAN